MARPLETRSIEAPGNRGLNLQSLELDNAFSYATVAENLVFDSGGRLVARKGIKRHGATVSGTPDFEQIYVYVKDDSTTFYIAAANNKIWSIAEGGNDYIDTPTDITPSSGTISANNWQFTTLAGVLYGFQQDHKPITWDGTGSAELVQEQHSDWVANTPYVVGNTVKAKSSAHQNFYMYCSSAGTSHGSTEPTWSPTDLGTIVDSGVTWTYVEIPRGNAVASGYGRLWAFDDTNTKLYFSDVTSGENWFGSNAGFNDLTKSKGFTGGTDFGVAIATFENQLVIFGKENILVFSGPDDPTASTFALSNVVHNIGCRGRDSVQSTGEDLIFLDETGVRSLKRNALYDSGTLQIVTASFLVRDRLLSELDGVTSDANIKAAINHKEGFYVLALGSNVWVFDFKSVDESGVMRSTHWTMANAKSYAWDETNQRMLIGTNAVDLYQDYLDVDPGDRTTDGDLTYIADFETAWGDFQDPRIKMPKRLTTVFRGGSGYNVNFKWGFDFSDDINTNGITLGIAQADVAEYNEAEYGEDEYSGGDTGITTLKNSLSGSGQHIKLGWSATINGNQFIFQKLDMHMKLGRLSR